MSMGEQAEVLADELGRNREEINAGEQRIRELQAREASLQRGGAAGGQQGSVESLTAELRSAQAAETTLNGRREAIVHTMNQHTEHCKSLNERIKAIQNEIDADSYAFYDNHKNDCEIVGPVEQLPNGGTRFHYRYVPQERLREEHKQHYDAWNEQDKQRIQVDGELVQVRQNIAQLDLRLREANRRAELEKSINQLKIEKKAVEELKGRQAEIMSALRRLLEALRSTSSRIRSWVEQAKEAARRLSE